MGEWKEHTFVVCAYQKSKYLEEVIESLENQIVKSKIIIITSTPNEYIEKIAKKHNIELLINPNHLGIGSDWNYGVSVARTKYITLAHQDDLYAVDYVQEIQKKAEKNEDVIIFFTNHQEIREGKIVKKNLNLKIKSILVFPIRIFKRLKSVKKLILCFGNPISCPSVCYNKEIVGDRPFREDMNSNIDWGTWLDFSQKKGAFIYLKRVLTFHRVHSDSETSKLIRNQERTKEDFEMFCRIWPKWFAKFLMIFYKHAQDGN